MIFFTIHRYYGIYQVSQSWSKIAKGLLKMYEKEVLSNRTIVQHLKFGPLFPFD